MRVDQQLVNVFEALCLESGSLTAMAALSRVRRGDWLGLVSMRVDPRAYDNAYEYYLDACVVSFLRKYPGFKLPGVDLKKDAHENFVRIERENHVTNLRLAPFVFNADLSVSDEAICQFITDVRKEVLDLLGPLPTDLSLGRHGKGSTFADNASKATVPDKMSSVPTITADARCLLPFFWETAWGRAVASAYTSPETVRGNRFSSVPKDALRDRGICIEPSFNIYAQLAVGTHIKERLLNVFGYDLFKAKDRHMRLAREGSLHGHLATIDLKDASDRQCVNLIRLLTGENWFVLLDSLRSKFTLLNEKWFRLEKFSSMGNGFTFELMTVILTAIAKVLYQKYDLPCKLGTDLSVFGDDIICHPKVARDLLTILPWFGYVVNENKTFIDGPFRESCGGDYFQGVDVRPYFLQEVVNEPPQWIAMANGIRRLGRDHLYSDNGRRLFSRAWFRALEPLPSDIRRLRGPEELGDLVIHDSPEFWQRTRNHNPKAEFCFLDGTCPGDGYRWFQGLAPYSASRSLRRYRPEVVLASALYGIPSAGVTPRDAVNGYRKVWLAHS